MKISLSRIESILKHSEQDAPRKPKVLQTHELVATDEATCLKLCNAVARVMHNHRLPVDWLTSTTMVFRTRINDQAWLVIIGKIDRPISNKQRTAAIVTQANRGQVVIIRKYAEFLEWYKSATR